MACQGTLKCPKCDLLMRPPTSKGSKFNPSNHLYEHYMEFKREWEKDGRTKDGALPLGSFCYQCWSKEADRREREGENIPQQSAYNLIYVSCFGKFRFRRKKDEEFITIEVLEPCNDHPLPPRAIKLREMMLSCSSCGNTFHARKPTVAAVEVFFEGQSVSFFPRDGLCFTSPIRSECAQVQ